MLSADAALILHRKGFDCGLEAKNLGFNCTTSQGKVSRARCGRQSSAERPEVARWGELDDRVGEDMLCQASGTVACTCGTCLYPQLCGRLRQNACKF